MSPPPSGWRIIGGANYKSEARPKVNPQKALREWIALADSIVAHGGEVAVLPPAPGPTPLTGLIYTANAGWLVAPGRFRIARVSVAHRVAERAYLAGALSHFGWALEESRAVWEGQADMCPLAEGAILLTYGVRSTVESLDEVRAASPATGWHAAKLQNPYFHGDTCMDVVQSSKGKLWLAYPGAFASAEEYRGARAFAEKQAEVLEIGEADALGYACNSLSLDNVLLAPTGLSSGLLGTLAAHGVEVLPLDFGELFGKGGGGPRCLVNELRGISSLDDPWSYRRQREALVAAAASYPTSA
jgi:N-dimethylarginine dimethylaminohydrolase